MLNEDCLSLILSETHVINLRYHVNSKIFIDALLFWIGSPGALQRLLSYWYFLWL